MSKNEKILKLELYANNHDNFTELKKALCAKIKLRPTFLNIKSIVEDHGIDVFIKLHLIEPRVKIKNSKIDIIRVTTKVFLNLLIARNHRNRLNISTFQAKFYKNYHPDLANLKISSWVHYQTFGAQEARRTSSLFCLSKIRNDLGNSLDINLMEFINKPEYWSANPSEYIFIPELVKFNKKMLQINPLFLYKTSEIKQKYLLQNLLILDAKTFFNDQRIQSLHKALL